MKSGELSRWYRTAILRVEQLYDDYLAERRREHRPMSGVSRWRDSGHLERAVETAGGPEAFSSAVAEMLDDARGWRLAEMRKRRDAGACGGPHGCVGRAGVADRERKDRG
jgi:hypothetical protein